MDLNLHNVRVKLTSDFAPHGTEWVTLLVYEHDRDYRDSITFFPPRNNRVAFLTDLADQIYRELDELTLVPPDSGEI